MFHVKHPFKYVGCNYYYYVREIPRPVPKSLPRQRLSPGDCTALSIGARPCTGLVCRALAWSLEPGVIAWSCTVNRVVRVLNWFGVGLNCEDKRIDRYCNPNSRYLYRSSN